MTFKPTKMQEAAINTDGNVLVSAAAGSGKTAVLVERVMRKLTDSENPIGADRLLVVTFTNAAAAEMRTRIEKRLQEEIDKNPNNIGLIKQKHLLPSADICTIDSFCIKLVRENFEKCGVQPDFKICEGPQLTTISKTVMQQLLQEEFAKNTADFRNLLELTDCEYDESNLASVIERIYLYSRQLPFPENFLLELKQPYNTPFEKGNVWYNSTFDNAISTLESSIKCLENMANSATMVNVDSEKYIVYAETVALILNNLLENAKKRDWDSFYQLIHSASLKDVPRAKFKDEHTEAFKEYKGQINKNLKLLCAEFAAERKQTEDIIKSNASAVSLLIDLINDYAKRLFDAFCAENCLTFYNTEQLALELLCQNDNGNIVAREDAISLSERYDEVLVDEFQDVNDLQDMLFYILSNCEEKLFVVGDIKQSIYGFRGSNPQNFLKKKNRYVDIASASKKDAKKINLSDNFRSRKGVCDTVNYFFSLLLAGQVGDLVYNEEERLNAAANYPETKVPTSELLIVDKADSTDDDANIISEAKAIAEYILSVMQEGEIITDKNGNMRKARFSDFAILLDKVKNRASVLSEVISEYGIPIFFAAEDFLETIEISTIMSLLQVIDNPKNDVELLCVMMSQIFGFTAEEMAEIRCVKKDGDLYSAVLATAETENQKVKEFLEKISELRRRAAVLPLDRLISNILQFTDLENIMLSMSSGKERVKNLYRLISIASTYSAGGRGSIYGFIKYINSLPDISFKASSSSSDCVRIMSMHNSKGLQFPICIIANLYSIINNADSISRVLFSENCGIAFKYYDEKECCDVEMLGHRVISKQASLKTVEERMRLLYVAMTRAEERLCLVSVCKDIENRISKIALSLQNEFPYITSEFLTTARTMGDWILAAALLHPDCADLRSFANKNLPISTTDSTLKLKMVHSYNREDAGEIKVEATTKPNIELAEKIKQNIAFSYPKEALRSIQAKISVSQLANSAESDRFAFSEKPAFMLKEGISAADRGTAMHTVMQFIALSPKPVISEEIQRLCEWQIITEQQAAAIDINALNTFFKGDIYSRLAKSKEVHRELRFLTEIPAHRLDNTLPENLSEEKVIVQGSVDLCFVEDDGIVVLDFKTDRADSLDQLVSHYGEQLEIYAKACEKIFGKSVKEKIIYSFSLNNSISF